MVIFSPVYRWGGNHEVACHLPGHHFVADRQTNHRRRLAYGGSRAFRACVWGPGRRISLRQLWLVLLDVLVGGCGGLWRVSWPSDVVSPDTDTVPEAPVVP